MAAVPREVPIKTESIAQSKKVRSIKIEGEINSELTYKEHKENKFLKEFNEYK